jgi:hypothetical protein
MMSENLLLFVICHQMIHLGNMLRHKDLKKINVIKKTFDTHVTCFCYVIECLFKDLR